MDALGKILGAREISEYAGNKKAFAAAGRAFLKQLLEDVGRALTVTGSKVSFNPGGPAVAGDPSLYFVTEGGGGCAVYVTQGFGGGNCFMYRRIEHMKDYRGGGNRWHGLRDGYEALVEAVAREAA